MGPDGADPTFSTSAIPSNTVANKRLDTELSSTIITFSGAAI